MAVHKPTGASSERNVSGRNVLTLNLWRRLRMTLRGCMRLRQETANSNRNSKYPVFQRITVGFHSKMIPVTGYSVLFQFGSFLMAALSVWMSYHRFCVVCLCSLALSHSSPTALFPSTFYNLHYSLILLYKWWILMSCNHLIPSPSPRLCVRLMLLLYKDRCIRWSRSIFVVFPPAGYVCLVKEP